MCLGAILTNCHLFALEPLLARSVKSDWNGELGVTLMEFNQGTHSLPSLLSMLNNKRPESILSAVNATSIELICELLSRDDYVGLAEQLSQESDVKNLLDFILHLLRDRLLPNPDETMGINRRARRLMLKIVARMPVIPWSLIVNGIGLPEKRDYIGSGGFGRVFKGELQGKVVALKVLYKSDSNIAFSREALMWRSLTHRFVLPFLGIYELEDGTAPQFFLVSPYMTNGTLAQWRKAANPSVAEIEERILQVAQGMEYIHSEGTIHGDLRGENILLDDNFHVQIADFGLTRLSEATNTRSGALHINFAAPELFGFSEDEDDSTDDVPARTQMSDVYAFGCLYYEIQYDSIPFAGKPDLQILASISRGTLPPRLDEPRLSDEAWGVIRRCWTREPLKRPRMNDIVMTIAPQDPSAFGTLMQELGLGDRHPVQMTSAERTMLHATYNQREAQDTIKRSRATLDGQRGVDWTNSYPPQKRQRLLPERPPIKRGNLPLRPFQPRAPPGRSQLGHPGVPMAVTTRAPPQMNEPITNGVPLQDPHMAYRNAVVIQQQLQYRKSKGASPQVLNPNIQGPINNVARNSTDTSSADASLMKMWGRDFEGISVPKSTPEETDNLEKGFGQWFNSDEAQRPQSPTNRATSSSSAELTDTSFGRDFKQWFGGEVPASRPPTEVEDPERVSSTILAGSTVMRHKGLSLRPIVQPQALVPN